MPVVRRPLLAPVLALVVGLGLVACTAQAPPPPPAPDPAALIAGAKALDQKFLEAFNTGNAQDMAALYAKSDDVVSFPPDAFELRGWQAISDNAAKMMAGGPAGKLEMTSATYRVAGDVVLTWGTWKMTIPGEAGATTEITGRYSDVKTQVDGKWVFLMDHASMAPTPPPAPPAAEAAGAPGASAPAVK